MTSSQTSHSVIRVLYLLLFSSYSGLHHTPPNVKLGYIACFLGRSVEAYLLPSHYSYRIMSMGCSIFALRDTPLCHFCFLKTPPVPIRLMM